MQKIIKFNIEKKSFFCTFFMKIYINIQRLISENIITNKN